MGTLWLVVLEEFKSDRQTDRQTDRIEAYYKDIFTYTCIYVGEHAWSAFRIICVYFISSRLYRSLQLLSTPGWHPLKLKPSTPEHPGPPGVHGVGHPLKPSGIYSPNQTSPLLRVLYLFYFTCLRFFPLIKDAYVITLHVCPICPSVRPSVNFLVNHKSHRTKIFSVAPSILMLKQSKFGWFLTMRCG